MSINKLISINNAIVAVNDMLNNDHDKDFPVFAGWAIEAEKEIGSPFALVRKKKVLTITGCTVKLPPEIVRLERAIMGDHGCDCDDLFRSSFGMLAATGGGDPTNLDYQGFMIIDISPNAEITYGIVANEVQNNKIVFKYNYDGLPITIQYLGYEVDCDGLMMVGENHIQAITEYILYKYCVRSRFSERPMSPQDLDRHFREWNRLCAHARGDDNQLTESERLELRALINDPYAGPGLWVNMYPTFTI